MKSASAKGMKSFLLSQQRSSAVTWGHPRGGPTVHSQQNNKIFINCENTFSGFLFDRQPSTELFDPIASFCKLSKSATSVTTRASATEDALYMRLDFSSKFDGAMTKDSRSPLDVVFVVDISGSMASPFLDDSDRRSKLRVAVDSLLMILDKLTPDDRVAVVEFNDSKLSICYIYIQLQYRLSNDFLLVDQKVLFDLKKVTAANSKAVRDAVNKMVPNGGTCLSGGLQAGYSILERNRPAPGDRRLQRVFFLTDMMSSAADEEDVLSMAERYAGAPPSITASLLPQNLVTLGAAAPTTAASSVLYSQSNPAIVNAAAPMPAESGVGRKRGFSDMIMDTFSSIVSVFSFGGGSDGTVAESKVPDELVEVAQATSPKVKRGRKSSANAASVPAPVPAPTAQAAALTANPAPVKSAQKKGKSKTAIYLTLVGIGVDLSVNTVNRLSAISGAKYMSAVNAGELYSTVAEDFEYDVSPLAFNIQVELPLGYTFAKVYGSAELNDLPEGATSAQISAEFPVPLEASGQTHGAIYACKLNSPVDMKQEFGSPPNMTVSWVDCEGNLGQKLIPIVATPHTDGRNSGLLKALILAEYVNQMTVYATTPEDNAVSSTKGIKKTTRDALAVLGAEGIIATAAEQLPSGTPKSIQNNHKTATSFVKLRDLLVETMTACGDNSLWTTNQNVLQTVSQVIELELVEIRKSLAILCSSASIADRIDTSLVPRGFMCPITLEVMKNPVIAADGHSYERGSITAWLASHDTSPVTNLPLTHKMVVNNHALKQAIDDFLLSSSASCEASDDDSDY